MLLGESGMKESEPPSVRILRPFGYDAAPIQEVMGG